MKFLALVVGVLAAVPGVIGLANPPRDLSVLVEGELVDYDLGNEEINDADDGEKSDSNYKKLYSYYKREANKYKKKYKECKRKNDKYDYDWDESDSKNHGNRGGDKDEHGCLTGAGYTWCESTQECIRPWMEPCTVGGDKDEHGCFTAAGYTWCESTQECIQPWMEPCPLDNDVSFADTMIMCDEGKCNVPNDCAIRHDGASSWMGGYVDGMDGIFEIVPNCTISCENCEEV